MTTLEVLESTVLIEQHAAARGMAKRIYSRVEELLETGETPQVLRSALEELYRQYRTAGQIVPRDAVAEVLDAFESLGSA